MLALAEIVAPPIQSLVRGETRQAEAINRVIEKATQALAKKDIEGARTILLPLGAQPDLSRPEIILQTSRLRYQGGRFAGKRLRKHAPSQSFRVASETKTA